MSSATNLPGNINAVPTPEMSGGNETDNQLQKNFESGEPFFFEDGTDYDFE